MAENAVKYIVVKKNGRFYPRVDTKFGRLWTKTPDSYDNLDGAINALKKERQETLEFIEKNREEIVYTLE